MFQRVHVDADRLVGDLVGFLDVGLGRGGLPRRLWLVGFLGRGGGLRRGWFCSESGRRGGFGCGLAEGALQFVERDLAGT